MKKILGFLLVFVLICLFGWIIYASFSTLSHKKKIAEVIGEIPEFTFLEADGSYTVINNNYSNSSLCIVYFNSECEFCLEEAHSIVDHQQLIEEIQFIFISIEGSKKIEQFGVLTGLSQLPNVKLGNIDEKIADEVLGITTAPQIFIYNRKGKLTKQFKGMANIEAILKYTN